MSQTTRAHDAFWLVAVCACILLDIPSRAFGAGPLPRLLVSVPTGTPAGEIGRTLAASGIADAAIVLPPITARVALESEAIESGLPVSFPAGIGAPPDAHLHIVLDVGTVPGTGRDREALVEKRVAEIVDAVPFDAASVKGLIVEVAKGEIPPELYQFAVATLIVKAKGRRPGLQISLALPDDALERPPEVIRRVVAYADSIVLDGHAFAGMRSRPPPDLLAGRPVILQLADAPASASAPTFLASLIAAGAPAADAMWVDGQTTAGVREVVSSYQFLARALGSGFEMTGADRAPAAVLADGQPVKEAVAFVASGTADVAVLLKSGGSRAAPRTLAVAAGETDNLQIACYDPLDGRRLPAIRDGSRGAGCTADSEFVFVHVGRGGRERLYEAVSVKGRAGLNVEEIIARWQAVREAERQALDNYSVPCFLTLHFEAASFGVGFDVSLDLQHYVDRSGANDWVQTGFFVNGVRFRKGQEFPLPLLEPEKVMTQPLELALDEKYVYRLVGTDTVDGVLSYVVTIEPSVPTALLYAGRVWIDGATFRQVRMQLEQRTGQHNISTHVETQEFRTARDGQGREFTVFRRIFVEEAVNVGGRPATVEKTYRFGDYSVNDPGFTARLEAARASDSPMFRDTDEGLRSLRRKDGVRVVEPAPGKRIESWLGGTVYDGSYDFPVPLFGVSLVDFNFRGKGQQLSGVFAGLLVAGNVSNQRSPSLRTSVEFALSALSTLNRFYVDDVAQTDSQFRTFEQSAGALASWQASPAWTLTATTHVAVQSFRRTDETSPMFVTPSTALILRAWGEAKYVKKSFDASVLIEPAVRVTGTDGYGWIGAEQKPERAYAKYQAEVNKHVYVGKLTRGGVTASYYGGIALDRLSLYNTSFLTKPRIVGVPAGVESFDAIGIAGAYYGFNVMDLAKLTGTYNHAWGRNRFESSHFRQFDGVTADIGTAGPWGTFVQATLGYTLAGSLGRYNQRWSAMVLVYKPMRR